MVTSTKPALRMLSFALAIALILLVGCGKTQGDDSKETDSPSQIESPSESGLNESTQESSDSSEPEYVKDDVVNSFIVTYNSVSQSPITYISEGNIRAKFYGQTYGHSIEMLNGTDGKIHISVSASSSDPDMASLRDAFHDVVITLDPSLSDEEIYSAYDAALDHGYLIEDGTLGRVSYMWFPTVDLSRGTSLGHFEVSASIDAS